MTKDMYVVRSSNESVLRERSCKRWRTGGEGWWEGVRLEWFKWQRLCKMWLHGDL